jgi:integrase
MGVTKYQADGKTWWRLDEWLSQPDGCLFRFRKKRIPTREQALALAAKARAEAFEGRFFVRAKPSSYTVDDAWRAYEPKGRRDNDAWQTDRGRAAHLLRLLGAKQAKRLTAQEVEAYRTARLGELTRRKAPPTAATLDREVELLKRILNHAVSRGELEKNPLAGVKLLRKPNVRRLVVDEEEFARLFEASEEALRPILLVAFDTGMREREILNLRWEQVSLKEGTITLLPQETKEEDARTIVLTTRLRAALSALPRGLPQTPLFQNPRTGRPWQDVRKVFRRARQKAGLAQGLWFHDLRRSFVTRSRKAGIPESVVMRMSGHRTRAVFERYNVVNVDDVREAARRLDEVWTRLGHRGEKDPHKLEGPTS